MNPRLQKLSVLGLAPSVGTPLEGITAEAIVVRNFEELDALQNQVPGKIVVYNQEWISYGDTAPYRGNGAIRAAEFGGVAAMMRAATPFSLRTPHTGGMNYNDSIPKIPFASITIEDAEMLQRMFDRGERLVISLKMDDQYLDPAPSWNTIAEIEGRENPEQVVVVSGHIDSYDVGQGVIDDAGGVFISWNALSLVKNLGLRPRRTMRSILWTAEETGLSGAISYLKDHINDTDNFVFMMEADEGTFTPRGLSFSGVPEAQCIITEILSLLAPINSTEVEYLFGAGSDITLWTSFGVPGASLLTENDKYFWYHHSPSDSVIAQDPTALDLCTAVWAFTSYVVADLSSPLPKNITIPTF